MLLNEKHSEKSHSVVYLFQLARFKEYVKIGISVNIALRADTEYGDFICYWKAQNRFHAFLVEQAVLSDPSLVSECPVELSDRHWPGYTEIRKAQSDIAVKVVQFYHDQLDSIGVYRFILAYLNPTEAERQLCEQKLDDDGDWS
jgi:hypothetical protein